MNTNVESLVFSMITLSATFPGAANDKGGGGVCHAFKPATKFSSAINSDPCDPWHSVFKRDSNLFVPICWPLRIHPWTSASCAPAFTITSAALHQPEHYSCCLELLLPAGHNPYFLWGRILPLCTPRVPTHFPISKFHTFPDSNFQTSQTIFDTRVQIVNVYYANYWSVNILSVLLCYQIIARKDKATI